MASRGASPKSGRSRSRAGDVDKRPTRAEEVAREIERLVVEGPLVPGARIGSEAELIERFGVSRGVLRQAIGLMTHQSVVEVRRGRNGGLVAARPDAAIIVDAATRYLNFAQIGGPDLFRSRAVLELECVRLVATHLDERGRQRLSDALEEEGRQWREDGIVRQGLHHLIAELSGNPALSLFVDVLARLTTSRVLRLSDHDEVPSGEFPERQQEAFDVHLAIGTAILAGDAETACRRMDEHLRTITSWLS